MKRMTGTLVGMVPVLAMLMLQACQSVELPWQKKSAPPVELLDETKQQTGTPATGSSGLAVSPKPRFQEVPVPEKAKEDLDRSYVYESKDLQIGRMVYDIRADVNQVANFYLENCPAAGWRLESVNEASGGVRILFTKPGKRLEVSVETVGLGRPKRLVLHLVPEGGREAF